MKKYTMQEFKKMFCDASVKAIEELDEEMKKTVEEKDKKFDPAIGLIFTMHNMATIAKLKEILFEKE